MLGKDAIMTLKLYQYQKKLFDKPENSGLNNIMYNVELPLLPILEDMERYGVNMNMDMVKQLYDKYETNLKIAEQQVYNQIKPFENDIEEYRIKNYTKKLDNPILLSSPSQLSILFYDILHYKTKSGKGTGVAELQEINTELTRALLEYRKLSKIIDAFLVSLPKKISPYDGKIHTSLNQIGAETGRFSSNSPNLQQIPSKGDASELRRIFGAGKGNILLSSDFSQQEPRSLASLSGDEKMQQAYITGKDLYSTMASEIYKLPYDQCTEFYLDENGNKTDKTNPSGKKIRSSVKSILLGVMYGRGTASVAEQIHSTPEEAQKIIDDFFKAYPNIKSYMEQQEQLAKHRGYTETAWGRRRYLPHIQDDKYTYKYNKNRPVDFNPLFISKSVVDTEVSQDIKDSYDSKLDKANYYTKKKIIEQAKKDGIDITDNSGFLADAHRQVLNGIIQGSSADMTKRAMIMLGQNEELKSLGFKMLFPVHDEIIAECPFENRKRCGELLSQTMIKAGAEKMIVPMKCDVEAFFYWYGPKVSIDDTEITRQQYEDYINKGIYKEAKEYIKNN